MKASSVEARRQSRIGAAIGFTVAALGSAALWGFTVDDALITARVAHHLATGVGYRMNPGGPIVDAVTPLGFAPMLAPFAGSSPLGAFHAARVIGLVAWLAAGSTLGFFVGRLGTRAIRFAPLGLVAVSVPLGAWASAGMETALVTLFATLALWPHRMAPIAAGLAAAWRPELLPWAMTLAIGTALVRARRPGPALAALVLAVAPAVCVAIARVTLFGMAMPLAALAKPSSLDAGIVYALRALVLTGFSFLLVSPVLKRIDRHLLVVTLASLVHFGAVALAGGDWMPLFRLIVPVLPGMILVGAAIAESASNVATSIRVALTLAANVWIWIEIGSVSRHIVAQRMALIEAAREPLRGAKHIASLDAGWVGAATKADVVDVAGVTDPRIARLAGGHTSKALPDDFLDQREVDAVVILLDHRLPEPSHYRQNDQRLARQAEAREFSLRARVPLAESSFEYLILRR